MGIDGRTAAGKTTLADELVGLIERRGRTVIRACIDDFPRPSNEKYVLGRMSPEGYYLHSFAYEKVQQDLRAPLGPGGTRQYRPSGWLSEDGQPMENPSEVAAQDSILLCDGVFLFRPELDDYWDYRIFVEITPELSLLRGVPRDAGWVGSEEEARRRYKERWIPGEQVYIDRVRPTEKADLVIDNSDPLNPRPMFNRSG